MDTAGTETALEDLETAAFAEDKGRGGNADVDVFEKSVAEGGRVEAEDLEIGDGLDCKQEQIDVDRLVNTMCKKHVKNSLPGLFLGIKTTDCLEWRSLPVVLSVTPTQIRRAH